MVWPFSTRFACIEASNIVAKSSVGSVTACSSWGPRRVCATRPGPRTRVSAGEAGRVGLLLEGHIRHQGRLAAVAPASQVLLGPKEPRDAEDDAHPEDAHRESPGLSMVGNARVEGEDREISRGNPGWPRDPASECPGCGSGSWASDHAGRATEGDVRHRFGRVQLSFREPGSAARENGSSLSGASNGL